MKNKKVVFFVIGINNGGLENYLLRFLEHQSEKFSQIIVFCKKKNQIELLPMFEKIPNVKIIKIHFNYFYISSYIKVFQFLRKESPDSICDFSGNISAPIILIAKIVGIRKRIVFYRNSSLRFKTTFFNVICDNILKKASLLFSTKILCNSIAGLDFYFPKRNINSKKFELIYNGIDTKSYSKNKENIRLKYNIPSNAFLVGHVGRFNLAKNHDTILKVAIFLCKNMSNFYFILCGRQVDVFLKDRVEFHDLSERIILLGNQISVNDIYDNIDCFYFPSLTEGQPNALIEAMVFGVPFVASNIPSIKETILNDHYSYLVDPYDDYNAIKKILEIYNNGFPLDYKDKIIEKFDPDIMFNKFYNEL